jgi:uncharacterized membrane protein
MEKMPEVKKLSKAEGPGDIETKMQKASMLMSVAGLGLMVAGFADMLVSGAPFSVPGRSVLPLPMLVHLSHMPPSLVAMSAGILLLGLLPTARVLLALGHYIRRRDVLDTLAALIVVLELLFSIRTGG